MQAREEADGSLVLSYDGAPLATWLAGIAAVLIGTAGYDFFIGSRGTERMIGLLAGAATCAVGALALFEQADFRFDATTKSISWRRRWGFRRRSGRASFSDVRRVAVEMPIGDEGVPSRRICLRMTDGSSIPITVGYRPDGDEQIAQAAAKVRVMLGHDPAPSPAVSAQDLVDEGATVAAVRLLVEQEGLSLADARQRVDAMKGGRYAGQGRSGA